MKRKNRVIVTLTPDQRCALSAAADLLEDLRTESAPAIDYGAVSELRAMFDALEDDNRTLGIELTAKEHRICSIAVRYAFAYLSEEYQYFYLPVMENVDHVLNDSAPLIRELSVLFPG